MTPPIPKIQNNDFSHSLIEDLMGSSRKITERLRKAVNDFVNKGNQGETVEVISKADVGNLIFQGRQGDGAISIRTNLWGTFLNAAYTINRGYITRPINAEALVQVEKEQGPFWSLAEDKVRESTEPKSDPKHLQKLDQSGVATKYCPNGSPLYLPAGISSILDPDFKKYLNGCVLMGKSRENIDPQKAKIIIAALFGFAEIDPKYKPTLAEIGQVYSLHQAIFNPSFPELGTL